MLAKHTEAQRVRAYLISALLLGAVAWPGFRRPAEDGFPFSTYPMFGQRRGRLHEVASARAVAADGSEVRVPPRYIANAETMQAIRTLSRAIQAGEPEAQSLCRAIAGRVREAREPTLAHAQQVELVSERVDAIDYLAGHAEPLSTQVHARCPIGGSP